jgi:DNA-directed RNA polymerase subunit H (RpoH/RPB5)|tara:strand:- start:8023 stop:8670 length:648 start_codon:yes stop_codon:yes gene_type:complete
MSQRNELEVSELFKSRENILELLKKQGYIVSDYENQSMTQVSVMKKNDQMDMLVETEDNKKAYVKYHLAKTLRANNVQEYIEDLMIKEDDDNTDAYLQKSDDIIIIAKDEPTESLTKALQNIWKQDNIFVTVHAIKRLQFNILNHELVPNHRVMNGEEVIAFKQKFQISNDKMMPDINRFSPVALAIGIRPGQICEIMRPSNTAIEAPFYRVCSG